MSVLLREQKTAYEIHERLVGSEMCIRDSNYLSIDSSASILTAGLLGEKYVGITAVSYTHLTLPTTPYV